MPHSEPITAAYEALHSGCGLVHLEGWTVVTLTGDDRHIFLHNMCTNEIKTLEPGQGCEAFCTDVKGKIIAHVFVLLTDDTIYLITVPDQADNLIGHLDRYIIREDVQLADCTDARDVTFIAGEKAEAVTEGAGVGFLAAFVALPRGTAQLAITENTTTAKLHEKLVANGATECPDEAWDSFRLEAGLPLYGVDFNADHLPQEVARNEQAINFNKGCYLGQETVARLDALGHVNKQLVTVKFPADSQPAPGIMLLNDSKPVGAATSVAWSPILEAPIGIAMVRRIANSVGTTLDTEVGPVEVVATPVDG